MTKINRLGIFSFAKFQSILFGLLGLILGIIYSFGGLLVDALVSLDLYSTPETPGLSVGTILAFGALIGMPLLTATVGFTLGIVEAIVFNMYSKVISGISLKYN